MRLTLRLIDTLLLAAILWALVTLLDRVPTDSRRQHFRQVSSIPVRIVNDELDVNVKNDTLDVDAGSDSLSNPVLVQIVR
jgi:hypothetical protein